MTAINFYALEAKFDEAKTEYMSLMNTIKLSCLGKDKTTRKCQKAAELNADMQTYLLQMSNQVGTVDISLPKQKELLKLSKQLNKDMTELMTAQGQNQDLVALSTMAHGKYLSWTLTTIALLLIITFVQKKNNTEL